MILPETKDLLEAIFESLNFLILLFKFLNSNVKPFHLTTYFYTSNWKLTKYWKDSVHLGREGGLEEHQMTQDLWGLNPTSPPPQVLCNRRAALGHTCWGWSGNTRFCFWPLTNPIYCCNRKPVPKTIGRDMFYMAPYKQEIKIERAIMFLFKGQCDNACI